MTIGEAGPAWEAAVSRHAPRAGTADVRVVRDVMLRSPKTLSVRVSVAEVREVLADEHVHLVLLTEDATLVGTVVRADLSSDAPGASPALPFSTLEGRTVRPDASADAVAELMVERGIRRLAVIGDDARLVGLICLKRRLTGFCSDADVASRAPRDGHDES